MSEQPPETTPYLRRRFNQLVNFVHNPGAQEILAEGTIHPARALVLRAVLATPGLPRFLYEYTQAGSLRRAGYEVLGAGYHAVTVSDGPTHVRKFYRETAGLSTAEQEARIAIWNAKQAHTLEHLGGYAVPQIFAIEEHPLDTQQSIVTATQERIVSTGTINLFDPSTVPPMAQEFLQQCREMPNHSSEAAAPDLIGRENAVIEVTTGAIKLVDPIALVRDDPEDTLGYERVINLLNRY